MRECNDRKKERENNIFCITDASVVVVSPSPFLVCKTGLVVLDMVDFVCEYAVGGIGHFAVLREPETEFARHVEIHSRDGVRLDSATA